MNRRIDETAHDEGARRSSLKAVPSRVAQTAAAQGGWGPCATRVFAALDELAAEAVGWPGRTDVPADPGAPPVTRPGPSGSLTRLAVTLVVAGSWGGRARFRGVTSRQAGRPRDSKEQRVV